MLLLIKIILIVSVFFFGSSAPLDNCKFPAIFNFGDSNSDTGAAYAAHTVFWPNGMTIGKVFKRFSDGLLVIDFLAESLGFPYLNASVDTNGTSFIYGANFAWSGQTISPKLGSYNLGVQVDQFLALKTRATAVAGNRSMNPDIYPSSESFSKALYTIDIGQNDVLYNFNFGNVSDTLDYFTNSMQRLLNNGAKYMWVHNTCPFGCLPKAALRCGADVQTCTRDEYGCITEYNQRSEEFNLGLKVKIDLLREQYPDAVLTLVDVYSAKYLLMIADFPGLENKLKMGFCCGTMEKSCATETTYVCTDPSKYISWDGVHYTQAANKILASLILNGTFSDPQVAVWEACHQQRKTLKVLNQYGNMK